MHRLQQHRDADAGGDRLTTATAIELDGGPLATDEASVLQGLARVAPLGGRTVVEVGGCIDPALLSGSGVRRWTAVDPRNPAGAGGGPVVGVASCASAIPLPDASADLAFSSNALQHVRPLAEVLAELHRVLRPGALAYFGFGPVWSAPDGAHVEGLRCAGRRYDFWRTTLLPAWAHLVLDAREVEEVVAARHGCALAAAVATWVSESDWINRLALQRILDLVQESPLELVSVRGTSEFGYDFRPPPVSGPVAERLTPEAVAEAALARHGIPPEHLPVRDVELVLRRS